MKKVININKASFNGLIYLRIIFTLLAFITLTFSSCKKFLEIAPPKDAIRPEQIFENDEIANSSLTGIYSRMTVSTSAFSGGLYSIAAINGLTADEFKSYNASFDEFYKNEISTTNFTINTLWSDAYTFIYTSNSILEGLKLSKMITENTKMQIEGEAKFIRAFCYFYLTNLFGEVPLNLTTDYRINKTSIKVSKEKIYDQIISDLIDAENLLPSNYVSTERIRPNKWAAKALLSRIYLYTENWDMASKKATEVIDQKSMYSLVDDLDKVFLKNSTEAIWQLMPPAGTNTQEGSLLILTTTPTNVSLSTNLMSLFEVGDNRKLKWTGEYNNTTGKYYYPYKYKIRITTSATGINEYSMIIRLAEIYLIRSEARAKLSQAELALEDINLIRKRAGLAIPLIGLNSSQCLFEIEKQRRLELFSEWGHRWLDLKRTNRATTVLSPVKAPTWQDTDLLYPIPDSEISRNPNVIQNSGY